MKTIKDPIYGYIEIDEQLIQDIVDTSAFQRLRSVRQTSYAPVFPASFHNRFVHSIGVYHLATMAISALEEDLKNKLNEKYEQYKKDFLSACLLHDIGHSPFSHSGENFYRKKVNIDRDLAEITKSDYFRSKAAAKGKQAAPHEVMSALVALRIFNTQITDHEFFARCITGYKYDGYDERNILISLLNSKPIDLDRLDYIIRDAFTSGFQSISVDYVRFLKGIRCSNGEVIFSKSAISVIENIIYAHDLEKKWIQSHPVIIYEQYLLQCGIGQCIEKYPELFSYEALTEEGCEIVKGCRKRLLSDDDIVSIMKNELFDQSPKIQEYFIRKERKHPIWKSEAEYNALFEINLGPRKLAQLEKIVGILGESEINADEKKKIELEIEEIKNEKFEDEVAILRNSTIKLTWLGIFEEFAKNNSIDFDFTIIPQNKFTSNFSKSDLSELKIKFLDTICDDLIKIGDISNVLKSEPPRENLFYLYHKEANKINASELASLISSKIHG